MTRRRASAWKPDNSALRPENAPSWIYIQRFYTHWVRNGPDRRRHGTSEAEAWTDIGVWPVRQCYPVEYTVTFPRSSAATIRSFRSLARPVNNAGMWHFPLMWHFPGLICNIKTNPLNSSADFMYRVNAGLPDAKTR